MTSDYTPFIIVAVLIFASIPITVALVQNARRNRATPQIPGYAPAAAPPALPGTRLIHGRYEFKSPPFKQGGMATIWTAKERATGKNYIIKTPRRGTALDNVYLDKLMLEAGYLKRLKHPNIVTYVDDYYSDGEFHLVLEFINGETLMSSSPRISPGEQKVTAWACQLLDALSYVHAAGIIHRDINPKNIMLIKESTVKLIDFGTAKDLNNMKSDDLSKDPFTQIANKGFDIPELFMGGDSDQRSDLCGVAQTCMFLFTLRQPNELCSSLISSNWPRTWGEAGIIADYLISAGASARTARCLAQAVMFEPANRFADALTMITALTSAKVAGTSKPAEAAEKK
jgi:serine/threonine protein kinase